MFPCLWDLFAAHLLLVFMKVPLIRIMIRITIMIRKKTDASVMRPDLGVQHVTQMVKMLAKACDSSAKLGLLM